MRIEIPLPTYSKRGQSTNLSLNQFRNLHYQVLNKCKRDYQVLYKKLLVFEKFDKPIEIKFTLYFNKRSASRRDLGNYGSMVEKIFCDAMVSYGMIPDDNIKYIKKITFEYGGIGNDYADVVVKELN